MENSKSSEKSKFKTVLVWSFYAMLFGGICSYLFLTGSPERALNFANHQSPNGATAGLGVIGMFGIMIWNLVITVFGGIISGFIVALGGMVYFGVFAKSIAD